MIEFLLSTSLSCTQASDIISRMEKQRENMGNEVVNELIHEVKNYVPECFNDEGSVHD
jgi:hypothetical protein